MSRIGKRTIPIPEGVEIQYSNGNIVTVAGPNGTLKQKISKEINVHIDHEKKVCTVTPIEDNRKYWGKWGLYRVLINNMIIGVTKGFQKVLEIEGVGYKAEMKGTNLIINVGYSHPVLIQPREGITIKLESPTKVNVSGINKQIVGQMAADIRDIRPPEPYKGKGIRYQNERILRKAGKAGSK